MTRDSSRSRALGRIRGLRPRLPVALSGAGMGFAAVLLSPLTAAAAINPVTQTLANDIIQTFTDWVAAGASWVLGQVVKLITSTAAINLSGAWFTSHYMTIAAMAAMVMLPMLCAAAVKSAFAADPALVLRAAFAYLPLAVFGIFLAIPVVNMLLQIVDWASAVMAQTLGTDYPAFAHNISCSVDPNATGCAAGGGSANIAAPFVIFISSVFMVIFGLLIFIELLFRNAAIYATAIFIPLALATIVFPSTGKIAKRLIETLVGLILLKFFIVGVFSIGVAALASQGSGGNFTTVLSGVVVLILAAVLPNLLIGLLPLVEGAAIATIASRSVTTQVIQPTSNQIYTSIRRQNELRATTGMGATTIAAGAAGGAAGVTLVGAATSQTLVPGAAALAGVSGASPGGGIGSMGGAGTVGSNSGTGSVGLGGGSILGGSGGGVAAVIPASATLGAVTGAGVRRVRGGSHKPAGPVAGG